MTFSGISRCDDCFKTQLGLGMQAKTAEQTAINSNQTYMHACDFCNESKSLPEGVEPEKQVWINMGQFSECQGCKIIGTNGYEIACPECGEYDYLFTKPEEGEALCSNCHLGRTPEPQSESQQPPEETKFEAKL